MRAILRSALPLVLAMATATGLWIWGGRSLSRDEVRGRREGHESESEGRRLMPFTHFLT